MIAEYKIVKSLTGDSYLDQFKILEEQVSSLISCGWQPFSNLYSQLIFDHDDNSKILMLVQAMVRYKDE